MAKTEQQHLEAIQRMFDDPDFKELLDRVRFDFFEHWQRERKTDERERIHAKLSALDVLVNDMRAAADTIAFEKQRGAS